MAWETKRMKDIFSFCKGLSITKEDLRETGVPVISYGQIHSKQNTGVSIADHLIRYVDYSYLETDKKSLTRVHDFIFADTSEDLEGCGNCVYVDRDMTLFAGYHTLLLKGKIEQDNKFLAYVFNTDFWRTQLRKNVCGVKLFSITQKNINAVFVSYPPLSEQQRIAAYLDKQTSSIDTRIALLEQKKEKYLILRKAVINEAVAGNGNDKEISWLGGIPNNWDIVRVKQIFKESDARTETGEEDLLSVSEYYGVARRQDKMTEDEEFETRADSLVGYKICNVGDLVINIMLAWKCGLGISAYEGIVSPSYAVYKSKGVNPQYYHYLFRTDKAVAEFKRNSKGIIDSRLRMYSDRFFNISIPVPPRVEQDRIVNFLNQKTSQIDTIVSKITDQIENLKVLRKCIINESVREK